MSLEKRIAEDLKTAMKAKDSATLNALRAVKSAILLAKTAEGSGGAIDDAAEMRLLQKLAKQREDSLAIYREQKRDDLAATEAAELAVLKRYLPEPMSDEELAEALKGIITQVGATSPSDMGKVMGVASKSLGARADGKRLAAAVRALLANA